MRVGLGYDMHPLDPDGDSVVLGGVTVATDRGVTATSDGDVLAHAIADALLGAAGLGDLGDHFPSADQQWSGADSMVLLATVTGMVAEAGMAVRNVDATVLAQDVRVAPHRAAIIAALADALGVEPGEVSVKATTTDHLGSIGRGEGVAAMAVVLVTEA